MENEEIGTQRWTAKRRMALVISMLKGETTLAEAARKHGLSMGEIEDWQEKFLLGAENALRSKPKDKQIKCLKQKVGELVLDIDILHEANKLRPFEKTFYGRQKRDIRQRRL